MSVGLVNAYANFSGDASHEPIKDASILKVLSGESYIDLDVKNVALPLKYKNTAKLIIDTNNMPELKLEDDAIFRRIIQISFKTPIPESVKTSDYMTKYTTESEMMGLLTKAVSSANLIITSKDPFKSTSIAQTKAEYESRRVSIIDHFISAHIQLYTDPEHIAENFEPMADVWALFKEYWFKNAVDLDPMKVGDFYTLLKSCPLPLLKAATVSVNIVCQFLSWILFLKSQAREKEIFI